MKTLIAAAAVLFALALGACASTNLSVSPPTTDKATSQRTGTPTVISMGDSFISGEGGRWNGSQYKGLGTTSNLAGDQTPTNRGLIYGDQFGVRQKTKESMWCHRSDVAVVTTVAAENGWKPINLACSGATTQNVRSKAQIESGETIKQLDQLTNHANSGSTNIKAILLSIGGNDLGFADVITDCLQITADHDCSSNGTFQNKLLPKRAQVVKAVEDSIIDIYLRMDLAGYKRDEYKVMFQGSPNIVAVGNDRIRSSEAAHFRSSPGVPLSDGTVSWAKAVVVPWMNQIYREATNQARRFLIDNYRSPSYPAPQLQFMDPENAFDGHELSSKRTDFIDTTKSDRLPDAATAEWVVPLDPDYVVDALKKHSVRLQESFHPNAFGEQALGWCATRALKLADHDVNCTGYANKPPDAITVTAAKAQ